MSARRYSLLFTVSAVISAADQVSKLIVQTALLPNQHITVIEGFFNLVYVKNPGGAFGFLSRVEPASVLPFFLMVTAAAVALVIYFYRKIPPHRRLYRYALAFILGGAVGNLIDRVRVGQVIDFLDFHLRHYHWPAFNLADACITAGTIMFLATLLRRGRQ